MDLGKRKRDYGRKRQVIARTRRPVSTQPNYSEGEAESRKLRSQIKDVSTSISQCGKEFVHPEKHSVTMEVGWSLMRFIQGKRGVFQKEIEAEAGVKILFPASKNEDSIMIGGSSSASVSKASGQIQNIIDKAVDSRDLDYSHFISLPLAIHPRLVGKLINFQNKILGITTLDEEKNKDVDSNGDDSKEELQPKKSLYAPIPKASSSISRDCGIDKSIFIKPKMFHLTVLMLKLWNKERLKAASEVLQSVSSKVRDALENRPVSIKMKGLKCMKGSLSKARVLYAPVEEIGGEGRLLRACQVIIDAYVAAGLVIKKDADQKLKFHATLMNARHSKRNKGGKKLDSFDARGIFDLYGSEEWGNYIIRQAHLSRRFVFDENGYYHCCASIPFPEDMEVE